MEKVQALRDFSGPNGSRSKGDKFDYDTQKDPDGLVKLGVIKSLATPKEPKKD